MPTSWGSRTYQSSAGVGVAGEGGLPVQAQLHAGLDVDVEGDRGVVGDQHGSNTATRGGDRMTQHSVSLATRGRDFVPDQPELAIALGDMVMWNCPRPAARPFAVVGDHPDVRTEDDLKRWREQIGVGTLVMIADGRGEPAEVDVVASQTVFSGPGITITDARLVEKKAST